MARKTVAKRCRTKSDTRAVEDERKALEALTKRRLARKQAQNAVRRYAALRSACIIVGLIYAARAIATLEDIFYSCNGVLTIFSWITQPLKSFRWVIQNARVESLPIVLLEAGLSVLAGYFIIKLSAALERAEDDLEKIGQSNKDVELQTAHASQAGGIWLALKTGNEEMVKALGKVDPRCLYERGPVGETPFHLMLLYGGGMKMKVSPQLRSAQHIGERWPAIVNDVYVGNEYFGESALHIAIVNENVELVEWLLKTSDDVPGLLGARATGRFFSRGQPCYYGEYALSFAVSTGQGIMLDILLKAGADAMVKDSYGNSCLHMAVIHNKPDMYAMLCERWRDPWNLEHLENSDGLTPLLFAARFGHADMFNYLLGRIVVTEWAYGPVTCQRVPLRDVDTKQRAGRGALEEIVENGHMELLCLPLMQELLQRKWDCFVGKLFYSRIRHLSVFLITMTAVHVTSHAESGLQDFTSTMAHTAKTGILGLVIVQLTYEYTHRTNATGQSLVSVLFCVFYLASLISPFVWNNDLVADGFLALSFLFAWFYFMWLFMGFKSTGIFVIMIYEILVGDVLPFGLILGIFVVAFSSAIYVVLQPVSSRSVTNFSGQLLSCFEWLTNGGFEGGVVESAERGQTLMTMLLATFTVLGAIVLLNLLIAMMGDTYARVRENAVAKWQLQRARIMLRLERGIPTPRRDRLSRGLWIEIDGERFLQVQLVNGLTALEQADDDT